MPPSNPNAVQFFALVLAIGVVVIAVRVLEDTDRNAAWGLVVALMLSILVLRTTIVDNINQIRGNIGVLQ